MPCRLHWVGNWASPEGNFLSVFLDTQENTLEGEWTQSVSERDKYWIKTVVKPQMVQLLMTHPIHRLVWDQQPRTFRYGLMLECLVGQIRTPADLRKDDR
jgi:hypothetical protein